MKRRTIFVLFPLVLAVSYCGKKTSDDDSGSTSVAASNPATLAYPTSLSITAFPNTTSTTSLMLAEDGKVPTAAAKNDEAQKIMTGKADSCIPGVFALTEKDLTETCYQFDQDMIYGTKDGNTFGTTSGKNTSGATCLTTFARNSVYRIMGQVDRSMGLEQAALCQRVKAGVKDLPAVNAEVDLTSYLKTAFGDKMGTVTTAKFKRLADNADGTKVFESTFDITRKDGVGMKVTIKHTPKDDDNNKYNGLMYFINDEAGSTTYKRIVSIQYQKADDDVKFVLRTARVATALAASAIDSNGVLDLNTGAVFTAATTDPTYGSYTSYANPNDAFSGMTYIAFSGKKDTNEGTFSFWQNPGGTYTERARGFTSSLTYDSSTKLLSGCATTGAAGSTSDGVSIRKSIRETKALSANGSYHPFFNSAPGGTCGAVTSATDTTGKYYTATCGTDVRKWYVPKITGVNEAFVTDQQPSQFTRTCFKQNATTGEYDIDTSKISADAGYELITTSDTSKVISPPTAPTVDVKK